MFPINYLFYLFITCRKCLAQRTHVKKRKHMQAKNQHTQKISYEELTSKKTFMLYTNNKNN